MKIKRPPKKQPSSNPSIAAFISSLATAKDDDLPELLESVLAVGWTWPRTDLQHWINPLNRFEKLLLENSTNRKIFASFDRLNDLLHTTDLTVLLAALKLGLRPAQQYSLQNNGTSSFGIGESRLLSLAQGWSTREYGLEMVDLAQDSVEIPAELDELEWQFYKRSAQTGPTSPAKDKGKEVATDLMQVEHAPAEADTSTGQASTSAVQPSHPSTPGPRPRAAFAHGAALATPIPQTPATPAAHNPPGSYFPPAEGLTTINLGNVHLNPKPAADILLDAIEAHSIPEPDRLDLLQKIRIAKSLRDTQARRTMLCVRLLAIAVFSHTVTEATAQSKLFLYEPELITQLAEMVHPDKAVHVDVQAAALYALDALAKFKHKLTEVASALNAGVSHGILMYVLRTMVADQATEHPTTTTEFVDALFSLLTYFHTNGFVGNMIVGAGAVNTLVELAKNQRRDRVAVVTKAVVFLDGMMYGYSTAFNLFIAASGLGVFVDRVKTEVDLYVEAYADKVKELTATETPIDTPTGLLSFEQAGLLKGLLRGLQRLMQTAGTTEGLRNLIDSSLLKSVKAIIENRFIFGSQVLGLAINMTATFVHNEPTCLATIQEAKVPGALYDAIEQSIPASIDVLQAIPNAIGALCLNAPGLAEFNQRPIIQRYFDMFTSERHVKVLNERDNAAMLGGAIDELTRHHPTLKEPTMKAIVGVFEQIRDQGRAFKPESQEGYGLELPKSTADAATAAADPSTASTSTAAPPTDVVMQDATPAPPTTRFGEQEVKENYVQDSIDVIGRFLEGMFQSMQHCKDFIKLHPVPLLLDLLELPCAPCLNSASSAFASVSAIFKMMSEQKAPELAQAIVERLKISLDKTRWLWDTPFGESKLARWLAPTADTLETENARFREVTVLLSYVALLSDLYANLTYAHGKTATAVLAVLATTENAEILSQIGQLYRSCTWETITLKGKLPGAPTDLASALSKLAEGVPPVGLSLDDVPPAATGPDAASTSASVPAEPAPTKSINFKSVEDVITNIPLNITPFLQAAIKMFVHRRSGDDLHRRAANSVATTIAQMMKDNLTWPDSADLNANLAYSTMMIGATGGLLFDERSNHTGLQTLLLSFFDQVGGVEAFLALYARYEAVASSLLGDSDANKAEVGPIVHVFGGLKIALDLLQRLSSQRTILEAPQTALLVSREKDKTSPDFFDPNALLVKLRAAILPVIGSTWQVQWLRKSPPNLVRAIVGTFINILKAEGETSTDTMPTANAAILGGGATGGLERMLVNALGGGAAGLLGVGPGGMPAGAPPAARAPFQLDQDRVNQLMDMGFPRSACETALTRCRNNIAVATEYLLQHPDLIGAARAAEEAAPAAAAPADGAAVAPGGPADAPPAEGAAIAPAAGVPADGAADAAEPADAAPGGTDVQMGGTGVIEDTPPLEPSVPDDVRPRVDPEEREKTNKEVKDKLNALRDEIKPQFLSQALSLAEDYGDLVYDIKGVFSLLTSSGPGQPATLDPLLEALQQEGATDQAIALKLRVLALLSTDAAFKEAVQVKRDSIMTLVAGFAGRYLSQSPSLEERPKWLAALMLVADSLFSLAEAPIEAEIIPADQTPIEPGAVAQGPTWTEHRETFFKLVLDVLAKGVSTREVFISTLRLLLVLTRNDAIAQAFLAQDGLKLLFSSFATERPETVGCRSYVVMIVRHLIEEPTLLAPMMEREIDAWFAHPSKSKIPDVGNFLRGASSIALRNIPAFLTAAQKMLKLVSADASGHYYLALQNDRTAAAKTTEAEAEQTILSPFAEGQATDATMEDAAGATKKTQAVQILTPAPSGVETTVHFLMAELLEVTKAALAPVEPVKVAADEPAPALEAAAVETDKAVGATAPPADKFEVPADTPLGDFYQATFGLSCLAELIASYTACKSAFLTFSTRRIGKEVGSSVAPKSRSSFLYYLLTELIPVGTIINPTDFEGRRRAAVSHWASLVCVSLCHDPESSAHVNKEAALEITAVRKAVLDSIARAFREATVQTSEPTELRYGRLFSLSDLCHRLLVSKPIGAAPSTREEPSMQIAKLMLEKNFAVILTNALAEVDLNFPNVNNLINTIMRPLETLTKVVTKVGRAKGTGAAVAGDEGEDEGEDDEGTDSSGGSEDDEVEEVEVDTEDDTPDLYRNSALGLFEGELEPGHDGMDESGEEEGFDEDDEMMEYEDEGLPAGSDVSDMSDDDGEGDEDMDDMEEILDETDGSSGLDDDSDSEGDDDDDPLEIEEGDAEVDELEEIFQSGGGGGEWYDGDEDEEDDDPEDGRRHAQIADGFAEAGAILAGEEDDPDSFTDEEEAYMTGELEFDQDMTDQLDAQAGAFVGGRGGRADAVNLTGPDILFDRPSGHSHRNPQAQTAQHPLLVETPANESSQAVGGSRRPRLGPAGARNTAEYEQWANSVEQMIGPGAVEALQQLLDNNGMPRVTGPDQVRLSITRGPDGGLSMMVDPSSLRGEVQTAPRGGVDPINALLDSRRRPAPSARSVARQLTDRLNASQEFMPQPTLVRWGEEGRVLQSSVLVAERVARLTNHLINLLHPPARALAKEDEEKRKVAEAEAEAKRKEEAEKAEREAAEAAAAAPASAGGEATAAESTEAPAAEADDPETMVRNLARSLATGLAVPSPSIGTPTPHAATPAAGAAQAAQPANNGLSAAEMQVIQDLVAAGDDEYEVEMDDDGEDDGYEDEHMFDGAMDSEDDGHDDDGFIGDEDEGRDGDGGDAPAGERVTIEIDGNQVDITGTGLDREFLEALPDSMRAEIVEQHFRETRRAAAPPAVAAAPSRIDAEFLNALPPDLRDDILRQEAAEQRREEANRARAAAAAQAAEAAAAAPAAGAPPAPAAAAPAAVHAAVARPPTATALAVAAAYENGGDVMEVDDFIASLPSSVRSRFLAELNRQYTNGVPQQLLEDLAGLNEENDDPVGAVLNRILRETPAKKATVHREAIQLLDKSGLATLVRLLFFPQPLKRGSLQRVLAHLSENSRTRTELIQLLLTILQDGTRDVSAVDKSFSQMSIRASKSLAQAGVKETPKRKTPLLAPVVDTPGGTLPHFPGESVPNLIAQRCLEALEQLVKANELSAVFFLTEQEVAAGLNVKRSAKKGKGKDKAVPSTVYPITVLLGLLDRPAMLKTQSMMDQLTTLLSTITKTLAIIPRKPTDEAIPAFLLKTNEEILAEREAEAAGLPPPTTAAEDVAASADPSTSGPVPFVRAKGVPAPVGAEVLWETPPLLPASVIRLVVNILDAGECSSTTFKQTLGLIQNLSYLPDAREIISEELKARAQSLSIQLKPDLDELLTAIQSGQPVRGPTLAKFSPASALQAKLLRILKTIDWLHSSKKGNSTAAATAAVNGSATPALTDAKALTPEEQKVSEIFASFPFEPVFQGLSACLSAVADTADNLNIATILLPLIEVVLVICKHVGSGRKEGGGASGGMFSVPVTPAVEAGSPSFESAIGSSSIELAFKQFTTEHKAILNTLIRANPGLMSGSFAILVRNAKILEFPNKRTFFFSRLHDRTTRQRNHYPNLQVNVRRQHVFEDSFRTLQSRTGDEIKYGKLNIKFYGEEGVDAGGVTREWFSVLARQMFNPNYALFQPQAADSLTYQPNKSSGIANEDHLHFFRFVGRIIGKALHDQRILEAYFSRSVYKHMLGKPVDHKDLESIDPDYYKSLVWMLENDIDGVLDLTMSVERDEFGVAEVIDLVPNGRNVEVTNANKHDYVRLIAENRLTTEIKDQIAALLKGLYEVVPKDLLQIFSEKELELLISGLPEIDVDEWRANTDLNNFSPSHPVIGYFWRAVRSFSHEERAKLLQFVSGSSRVPLEGFGALQGMSGVTKFSITNAGAVKSLPTAHTCFNQLDLASGYESYEELRAALVTSITEGAGSFGFA